MNREHLSFFNLNAIPFTKEIPQDELHLLPSVEKSLKSLELLAGMRGIGVLTGQSGTGKSSLIRLFISRLNQSLYKPIYICHTSTGVAEFYGHICSELGLPAIGRKASLFRQIKERFLSLSKSQKIHPVLIIDEAQCLNAEVLNEIRLLTNFEIDSYNALTTIFCGHESFRHTLRLNILESLTNSISISVVVETLSADETVAYIEKRMQVSGAISPVFSKNAFHVIHQASGGIFRIVNTLCISSLIKAFLLKSQTVEAEHVQSVIER